jgi:chromosomal replication initiator protein DnaA
MLNGSHVWRGAQERLRQEMSSAQFETWLRGTQLLLDEDGAAELQVRTTFAKELLESRYRERIEAAIAGVIGAPCALEVSVCGQLAVDGSDSRLYAGAQRQVIRQARPATTPRHGSDYETSPLFRAPVESGDSYLSSADVVTMVDPFVASEPHARTPRRAARPQEQVTRAPTGSAAGGTIRPVAPTPVTRQPALDGKARMDPRSAGGSARDEQTQAQRLADEETANPPATTGMRRRDDGGDPGYAQHLVIPAPKLNSRYTFSTFIVGAGNQLAHAASLAVAEAPGHAYNPLFLYGGVGLGKTHLLHAIGHTALENGMVVLYVSSETFTNEMINAIRYRTNEEFRAKYRSADVLLVDDIQFIAGKDSTEEEFFHTFNSLYESNKQIVMCSDRPPKAIVSLEERLRSRFEWGLIADIQPPDLETRVAILRAKADLSQRMVPDDVIQYLASRVQSNIRELEGSLNRLLAFSQLQRMPLTIDTAKAALANLASDARQRRVSIGDVLNAVAEYYRLSLDDLRGKQRDKHIVVPRQVAMYLMRQETESSLLEIGQSLGGRDHSTVLHGCDKISREVNENTALRKEVLAIRQQLSG